MRARLVRSPAPGILLTACLAAVLAAGCGSSGSSSSGELAPNGSPDGGPAPAPVAAPSVPPEQLYETVLQRYRDYQAAYKRAYETNNPAELTAVAIDPLLTEVSRDIEATKAKGQIWRFANTFNPRVYARSKDNTKMYVIDCVRTLVGYRYSAKTGQRIDGGPGGAFVFRTTLQYGSGTWKAAATVRDKPC